MFQHFRNILTATGFAAACLAAAGIGQLFSGGEPGDWYRSLQKPIFTPPGWLFGPVWTLLYVLMGVAVWLVWRERSARPVTLPLALFIVQLALNVVWTPLFFGLQNPGVAFVDILLLWIAIAATVWQFFGVSAIAGFLMLPYLAWVSFACALNFAIWRLNG